MTDANNNENPKPINPYQNLSRLQLFSHRGELLDKIELATNKDDEDALRFHHHELKLVEESILNHPSFGEVATAQEHSKEILLVHKHITGTLSAKSDAPPILLENYREYADRGQLQLTQHDRETLNAWVDRNRLQRLLWFSDVYASGSDKERTIQAVDGKRRFYEFDQDNSQRDLVIAREGIRCGHLTVEPDHKERLDRWIDDKIKNPEEKSNDKSCRRYDFNTCVAEFLNQTYSANKHKDIEKQR